ncbi:MAG: NADP-dependent isocitrate dehydrogenase [Longimicrobiales bacterium]|nr:NADP-dependent isocitrate dehydrogenase [Longimicrobiales bacterium]
MNLTTRITVARGDGIGPEIMDATLRILDAAGALPEYDEVQIGEKAFLAGNTSGIPDAAWETIRRNSIFLKAPITTPQGGGYKSLNVTIRKSLNLFANVRPSQAYTPAVPSPHPEMDLVIVRENEEDLYAGIEHRQTQEVTQVLKLITRPGSERIVRYAFEYARAHGRKKVTCMTKDNIMKHTDGLFHQVFREVAEEYTDIDADHQIIDIGTARLATDPDAFDVIVTLNLYGDILSDVASQLTGSVGLGGSSNIGERHAMFEAVHGSAPDIAGEGIANPSGLLLGAVQMLVHMGATEKASRVMNAWLTTLEDGVHTGDIFGEGRSTKRVGTDDFASAVIERLGDEPRTMRARRYSGSGIQIAARPIPQQVKTLEGIDIFTEWADGDRHPDRIGAELESAAEPIGWKLKMITNRGVKVFPGGFPETFLTDHWRCRFLRRDGSDATFEEILELLAAVSATSSEVIKTEHLYRFDGERGYSLGQGE